MEKEPSEPTSPEPEAWEASLNLEERLRRLDPPPGIDVEAALRQVKARFHEANVYDISAQWQSRLRQWRRPLLRTAAAIAVVLGAAVFWRSSHDPADSPNVVAAAQTFETGVGQTDSLTLTDGTAVVLGPGSRLVVRANYGARSRMVELNGTALFDVKHDAARSFSVYAADAVIKDLGTTFTVQSDVDGAVRVAVTVGTVVLHATGNQEGQGVVLRAGDRGRMSADGDVSAQPGAVTESDLAWTEGRLVFENAPLSEVSAELRRWYGVDLEVQDPALTQRHVTASFKQESVEQVLDIIGLALGARVERNGETAVLRAR